jgi:hypothetical protein
MLPTWCSTVFAKRKRRSAISASRPRGKAKAIDERTLADAGLAADEGEPAPTGRRLPQPAVERLQVPLAINQFHESWIG